MWWLLSRNKVVNKKHCESSHAPLVIYTSCPICICIMYPNEKDEDCVNRNPCIVVPCKYLTTRLVAAQCIVVGFCKYWHNLLMTNAMAVWVFTRYNNAPIIEWYNYLSVKGTQSFTFNFIIEVIGVRVDLDWCMNKFHS